MIDSTSKIFKNHFVVIVIFALKIGRNIADDIYGVLKVVVNSGRFDIAKKMFGKKINFRKNTLFPSENGPKAAHK